MNGERQIDASIELLDSSFAQITSGHRHSQEAREAVQDTNATILKTLLLIRNCDREMKTWWYRASAA